jgi:hypothetical protein
MSTPPARAATDDADRIVKAMSDYLVGQKTISLTFDSTIEVITPELEKIQFANSGSLLLQRPDKLRATRTGGYADVELTFDGETFTAFGKNLGRYIQLNAAGSVDKLIDALHSRGVGFPGADLLLSDVYQVLMTDVLEAKHIGRGVVGGVECEHLAFRQQETDWQLWVEVGPTPVPRKLVITSKTVSAAPQYTLVITEWSTGAVVDANSFVFKPPEGAEKVGFDALSTFDELPPGEQARR